MTNWYVDLLGGGGDCYFKFYVNDKMVYRPIGGGGGEDCYFKMSKWYVDLLEEGGVT